MPRQILTLHLDGITASDYLAHLRDPDAAVPGCGLRTVTVTAAPLGDTIEAVLEWEDAVPPPRVAAAAAGLPLVAEVVAVAGREAHAPARRPQPAARAPRGVAALVERFATRLAMQSGPVPVRPLLLHWG